MPFDAISIHSTQDADQVIHGLNLTLELADPDDMPKVLIAVAMNLPKIRVALKELHFVHSARFLPVRGNAALLVITEFDGPLQHYVMDFAMVIGDIFTMLLEFVKNKPPLPVKDHPYEFWKFVQENNRVALGTPWLMVDSLSLFSAYPTKTVIDILGPRTDLPPPVQDAAPAAVDLADTQGNIVNGYHAELARHFVLSIDSPPAARGFLKTLIDGPGDLMPRVTTAERWTRRPSYFLNVGLTADGLRTLGVPTAAMEQFPRAFLEGPANDARAESNGDWGSSAPREWLLGQPSGRPAHLLVSLYGDFDQREQFEVRSAQLSAGWEEFGLTELSRHDATALPDDLVHFGYKDGMSQPQLADSEEPRPASEVQPLASVGDFVLSSRFPNVFGGRSIGSLSHQLCENATYGVVRMLEQDVAAFEKVLDDASEEWGVDREWVAAKLMGRWRDGRPLASVARQPADSAGKPGEPLGQNAFDYAPSYEYPDFPNDHDGLACPVGAHVRRMNPRSARVAGKPHSRRLIRRGMPYGPDWSKGDRDAKRGLFGLFFCGDIERQFEFLMQVWANGDGAASGIRGTRDPIIGAQSKHSEFRLPVPGANGGPPEIKSLQIPRLVTTRGSLYLLVPGVRGLRYLADLHVVGEAPVIIGDHLGDEDTSPSDPDIGAITVGTFDPVEFDPKNPAFLANPYPYFSRFRRYAPVARVRHGSYSSYWVFSHKLVTAVCEDTARFLKRPVDESPDDRGLFYMDPPRHTDIRFVIEPLFQRAIADATHLTEELADEALADIQAQGPVFDLIPAYANRVTRNVFMTMMGVPREDWQKVGGWVNSLLEHFDQMLPLWRRAPAELAKLQLTHYFSHAAKGCPVDGGHRELLCAMQTDGRVAGMHSSEVVQSALHFALGGYLSTEFLIGTGLHNLLSAPDDSLQRFRDARSADRATAIEEMKRYDAPFQMADRFAAEDLVLGGVEIPAGKMVTVVYGSANRDESVFGDDADRFRIDRQIPPGRNYVFGHGIHHCIGAPLVARVVPVMFDRLLKRMPDLKLNDALMTRHQDPYFRAFSSLELVASGAP